MGVYLSHATVVTAHLSFAYQATLELSTLSLYLLLYTTIHNFPVHTDSFYTSFLAIFPFM